MITSLHRLITQGVCITVIWLYTRAVSMITGIPIMKYSRITSEIYVGPQYRKAGKLELEKLGIKASVNLRFEFNDAAHGLDLKDYCYIPVVDDDAPSFEQLNQGIIFIQKVLAAGGKVYVHCRGGLGRAPTMVAAYFLSKGFSIDQAIGIIRKVRPFIEISAAQMERLKHFSTFQQDSNSPRLESRL